MPSAEHAIRECAAVTPLDWVHVVRFAGDGARSAIDRLCAGTVRTRDGQMQHVLLLDGEASCFADAYLVCDSDHFDLVYEGPTPEEMAAHLALHLPPAAAVAIEHKPDLAVISVDGPFAWELTSRLAGAVVAGLPYLTFFHFSGMMCYRAGKTGEYCFGLVVPRARKDEVVAQLQALGAKLDVVIGSQDALDQCALENFHFNIRREGRVAGPIELQLQWRVAYDKSSVGADALRRHRAAGIRERVTTLVSNIAVASGDDVRLDGEVVGRVVNAGRSETRGDWIALALLHLTCAYPGVTGFEIGASRAPASSMTPPLLNNRSLFVSPQVDAYARRASITFPTLVRQ